MKDPDARLGFKIAGDAERFRQSRAAQNREIHAAPIGNQGGYDALAVAARGHAGKWSPHIAASSKPAQGQSNASMRADAYGAQGNAIQRAAAQAAAAEVTRARVSSDDFARAKADAFAPPVEPDPMPENLVPPAIVPPAPAGRSNAFFWGVLGAVAGNLILRALR
jgi:hypothetical protein